MSRRIHATAVGLALLILTAPGLAGGSPDDLQSPTKAAIQEVLEVQQAAWNRGDLDAFMTGYWRSAKTEFVGANGVQRGWQAVLDRYRRTYPDRKAMGKLAFSHLEITLLPSNAAYVLGHYELEREADHPEGVFTLILRKFPEGWRIIHDHTTAFPAPVPK